MLIVRPYNPKDVCKTIIIFQLYYTIYPQNIKKRKVDNMETTVIVLGNKPNLWKNKAQRYPTGRKNNKSTGSVSIGFYAASNIIF